MREEKRRSKSASSVPDVRLAVIGGASVGKSDTLSAENSVIPELVVHAISVRFLTKRFIGEYQRNVERTYRRSIRFGPNIIQYDLKDTGSILDRISLITWSTCVAVVYSITDKASFCSAAVILSEIENNVNGSHKILALIGNKKDLHHLREVSKTNGKKLANKYGAGFWEVSAADDYHSIFGPLNSLIVESYLSTVATRNPDSNRHSTNSDDGRLHDSTSSGGVSPSQRNSKSSYDSDGDFDLRTVLRVKDEDIVSVASTSTVMDVFRTKKKPSLQERTLHTLDENKDVQFDFNNNKFNPVDSRPRANSWARKEKKRSSLRKSTETKIGIGSRNGLKKSRSFSDIKSYHIEQEKSNENCSSSKISGVAVVTGETSAEEIHFGEKDEPVLKSNLLEVSKKIESSSFTKLTSTVGSVIESSKSGWNRVRKNQKKIVEMNGNEKLSDENVDEKSKVRRSENRRSVRRKISQILKMDKPKIVIETS